MTYFNENNDFAEKSVNSGNTESTNNSESTNKKNVQKNVGFNAEDLTKIERTKTYKLKNQKKNFQKKLLKGYSKIHELKLVTIGLASPEKIKSWAEKELPNGKIFGEVTNANTFHYKTFKPSKGGLFCERIFGPIKDFECACQKRQRPTALESRKILEHEQTTRYFCPECDVEYTWSIIRRYQLGYIKLNAPVTHLWYFKTNPSYLSILFDMKRKHLESIIYCTENITIENMWKTEEQFSKFQHSPTELYKNWQKLSAMEDNIPKYSIMIQQKKKRKKQKKTNFRENCAKKGFVFQKLDWSQFHHEFFSTNMSKKNVLTNPQSENYFESFSEKKTQIFLNIYKQKQKQLFSYLFHKIWKSILQKTYKTALCEIAIHKIISQNYGSISQLFWLNSSSSVSKKFQFSTHVQEKPSLWQPVKKASIGLSEKNSKPVHKNKHKIQKFQKIFFQQNFSSTYLKVFSKKNKNYENFQKCSVFFKFNDHEEIATNKIFQNPLQTFKFSVSQNLDHEINSFTEKKTKNFWNSFYFLFETGIYFLSLKKQKRNLKSFSKKELFFLINILPFFQKIFFYKKISFFNKNYAKIQKDLFTYLFFSKKKNIRKRIDWNRVENSESALFTKGLFFEKKRNKTFHQNSKNLQEQSFKQSKTLFSFVFSKKKKTLFSPKIGTIVQYQTNENISNSISSGDFLETLSNLDKILWYFKQYYEIEFCLAFFVFKPFFSSSFLKQKTTANSNDFFFYFFQSVSQQIDLFEQKSSRILQKNASQNNFSDQKNKVGFLNNRNTEQYENMEQLSQNIEILNLEYKKNLCEKSAENIEEFCEHFFEQSKFYSVFEKLVSQYFYFFLFLLDTEFVFSISTFPFQNLEKKPRNFRRKKNYEASFFFFNIFRNTSQCKKTNGNKTVFHPMIFKFQELWRISFSSFSRNIFENIAIMNRNQKFLNKFNNKYFIQNSVSQDIENTFKIYENQTTLNPFINSKKFEKNKIQFFRQTQKIQISNDSFVFPFFFAEKQSLVSFFEKNNGSDPIITDRKKMFQKKKQFQKKQFLPWISADEIVQPHISNSKKETNESFLSSEIPEIRQKFFSFPENMQKTQNQVFEKPLFSKLQTSLKIEHTTKTNIGKIFHFSLFSQKKQKSQTYENKNFLKNPVYTIAYNSIWHNDSDWKYFVYYHAFFMTELEDMPIFEYRNFTKQKNAFLENSSSANIESSIAALLSVQLDTFKKKIFVGAGILEKFLTEYTSFELRKMTKQHQILLPKINQKIRVFKQQEKTKKDSLKIQRYFQKREHIIRRLKFLRKFFRRNSNPSFMILRNLPVLPPDLRPILKLQNQIAASDLNRFYQRIIYRNDRFKKFSNDSATNQSFEMKYAQRLLQEAVDNLIQNGKGGVKAETNSRGQALKSLSEILKGKQGRFRQYLLGKRVDYSGRSVIVVGPQLKLYECGLPKEMALELFLPFLIQYILQAKLAQTVIGAKNLLKQNSTLTFHLLNKVMKNIPVLLNRAPTLHRLGFQAFLPKLIEGRAILLHPMVCPGFNADFDGDQMAVHIPLTVEARTEAWKFMLATNNLMNSATGEPILLPSQDMVLGCYFLTLDFSSKAFGFQLANTLKNSEFRSTKSKKRGLQQLFFQKRTHPTFQNHKIQNFQFFIRQQKSFLLYNNFFEILAAYQRKEIALHTPVWVKCNTSVNFGNDSSKPIEIRLQKNGQWQSIHPKYTTFFDKKNQKVSQFIRTTPGRILMNFMIRECIEFKKTIV